MGKIFFLMVDLFFSNSQSCSFVSKRQEIKYRSEERVRFFFFSKKTFLATTKRMYIFRSSVLFQHIVTLRMKCRADL